MRILFLTMVKVDSIESRGIYTDLLRKFRNEGHEVFIVCPNQRRNKEKTTLVKREGVSILKVRTLNVEKSHILEKGLGQLLLERQYLKAIKQKFPKNFDLILYSTPPITFFKIIKYIKNRDNAFAYLLLKDIFPQNAIDMKMIKLGGVLHRFFQEKEKKLYRISDVIGCMSLANKNYLLEHNPFIVPEKVEVNPNTIQPLPSTQTEKQKIKIKEKYDLPLNKKIFVYGGNLGVPQGINFLIKTIKEISNKNTFFLIVGSGTQFKKISMWFDNFKPTNAILFSALPKKDYDELLQCCDFGMIFLHKDFTIPNFPSRLLSYLEVRMPVIAATDTNTDIGKIIESNQCGYWVEAGNIEMMKERIDELVSSTENKINEMKNNAWNLLENQYTVDISYKLINSKIKND